MEQSKIIASFRLTKHDSKIELDMFDVQSLPQIKQAINRYYGDFIRDLGQDNIPNFDILCYTNVVLTRQKQDRGVVECKTETSNVFVYDILSLANSNISGEYNERKDMLEVFYDQYLHNLNYIEFSESESFNQSLIQKVKEQKEFGFNLEIIENLSQLDFNLNVYMECLNFIQNNDLSFQKANNYYEGILQDLKSKYGKAQGYWGSSSQTTQQSWIINLIGKLIDLGVDNKLNDINKNLLFDFCWENYIHKSKTISNDMASCLQSLVWLFDWEEWEEKFEKHGIMDSFDFIKETPILGRDIFAIYTSSTYVFLYAFALRPDISEAMSLRLFEIFPEVLKQNQKYQNDVAYTELIRKRIQDPKEISTMNLYKIFGYLINDAKGIEVLNTLAWHSYRNFGLAFANYYLAYKRNGLYAYNKSDVKNNPFNGFGEKADYEGDSVWLTWRDLLENNYSDFSYDFYCSLMLHDINSNLFNGGISFYINSDEYIKVIRYGYEANKNKSSYVSEIFGLLTELLDKIPDRNKRSSYSVREKGEIAERIAREEFIADEGASKLLTYIVKQADVDSDLSEIPYILLNNEAVVNDKSTFLKIWDICGSKHKFREQVAKLNKMPRKVYRNLARSKSEVVQNNLKPENEITFIK